MQYALIFFDVQLILAQMPGWGVGRPAPGPGVGGYFWRATCFAAFFLERYAASF